MLKNSCCVFSLIVFGITNCFAQSVHSSDSTTYFKEDSSRYFLIPISINSPQSDFCPVISNGELIFVSGRDKRFGVMYSNETQQELLDMYACKMQDSITFDSPKKFSRELNSPYNDGPASFSADQNSVVFTSNTIGGFIFTSQTSAQKNLQLYSSVKQNNSWSQPQLLNFCLPGFSYCHPCLTADGKTLFFASDKPGGFGGMDLYCSVFENNQWSNPVNLGPKVNTEANEVFPFLSPNRLLYFSSDNKSGYGGLDIYCYDFSDTAHSQKYILEAPLNSAYDDFGVYIDSSGRSGYISSNRNQKNEDDIFYFYNKYPYFNHCSPFVQPSNCFTFFEESTEMSDDTLGLTYEWSFGDGTKAKGLEASHCYGKTGDYKIELNIIQKASGALFYNEASYDYAVEDSSEIYINAVDTLALNNPVNIDAKKSKVPGRTLLNYFWSFGDGTYSCDVSGLHAYKKCGAYTISLGVVAKNDSSQALENYCSEKQIVVAPNSWVKKTNSKFQLPKNSELIYPTTNTDSLNFRVHLGSSPNEISTDSKIFSGLDDVKSYKDDSIYRYTSGKSNRLTDLVPNYNLAKKLGFTGSKVIGFNGDSLLPHQEKSLASEISDSLLEMAKDNSQNATVKRNVFFDSNKYQVASDYYSLLDSLSTFVLQNPKCTISLYAFSDSVGNPKYNYQLSKRRANAVEKYFLKKGIKNSRIKIIANGEEFPAEEKKEGLLYSRRVSIYITKN